MNRFFDLIPEQHLDLRGVPSGPAKTSAIEEAYRDGFSGAFLPGDPGTRGRIARWDRDEFRDSAGRNQCFFSQQSFADSPGADTEYGYIASHDAFTAWRRDKAADAQDWLFKFAQNSGNCVGASGVEMYQGMQGTRAMDPANNERMSYLAAMWAYAFRGFCGAGWTMSAHATVTLQHGYCFAFPRILNYDYGGEQDSEDLTVSKWCRGNGPPQEVRDFVDQHGWRFESGSITEFDGNVEMLMALGRRKGQFHHGSNVTSGSHRPDVLTRIGGHAQTMYGISWHPLLLAFYELRGFKLETGDAWTFNHQTWGEGFSGEISDELYPYGYDSATEKVYSWAEAKLLTPPAQAALIPLGGPKPQGAWVCSASKLLKNVDGYSYLPLFKGLPGDGPPPTPTPTMEMTGRLTTDFPTPVRGSLVAKGTGEAEFIIVPDGTGGYIPIRKQT